VTDCHEYLPSIHKTDSCARCGDRWSAHRKIAVGAKRPTGRVAGRPRVLTDAEETAFIDWYLSQQTLLQKAAELGVSVGVLQSVLVRHGVPRTQRERSAPSSMPRPQTGSRAGKPRILSDNQALEFIAWYKTQMTLKQKARQMGVTTSALGHVLIRHGIERTQRKRTTEG